ncbi:alpha/beta hydrolase [Piscinibacter sp.]|uniref:alpha/beta hydrolase n=1 Tax=Piscinibacter sp. TaxID=1903157 RepID=UPI002CBC66BD|nr:lysophospholipase [Albitalea sp.]HUG23628.1 lysophospholipase [Albitalea sp.]
MDKNLTTTDGLTLHVQSWPAPAAAHGTVLIVHGLGEHIGRYARVAARLNAKSWNVIGHDHRGHGRSGGVKGCLNADDDLLRDLALVVDSARAQFPGPLVLLGHSMGGLVAARFVAEGLAPQPAPWHRAVDALVLSSPALDPGMNAVQKLMLSVAGPLAPNLAVNNGLKPEWISRDAAVVAAYKNDPLVHDRIAPRLARFIVDGGRFVLDHAAQWKLPTLLLWAGSDRCVAPAGSAAFAAKAPPAVLTSQAFGPLFHEIFNEPEQDQVFSALEDWLARRGH